ncbi:MAG TPA: preprotein translocase subunit SecE [Candidatus Limnocylindrales bacterium]|nr:preprotein translocase subunit SecE [Candidatus Limnocylindrales bacterium]
MTRIRRFTSEAISELKKVSWPTVEQTRNLTVLVFTVSLAVGIYIFVVDGLFRGVIGFLTGVFR